MSMHSLHASQSACWQHTVCTFEDASYISQIPCPAGFNSLIDELYDAGLLAVGALEKGLGLSTEERKASGSSTSSSNTASSAGTSSQRQQPSSSDK